MEHSKAAMKCLPVGSFSTTFGNKPTKTRTGKMKDEK